MPRIVGVDVFLEVARTPRQRRPLGPVGAFYLRTRRARRLAGLGRRWPDRLLRPGTRLNALTRDRPQAAYWYAQAAEQGHGWAQFNLAWGYRNGVGNDTDPEKALYWLTRAADGGLAGAQVYLGTTAMRKAVTDEERLVAAAWLARAAALDDPSGVYLLGRSFELGMGNAQDDAQAAALYRRALGRSAGRADTALGILLDAGRAVPLLDDEAARLYEQGMQARHAPAFYRYGLLLEARGDEALAAAVFQLGAGLGNCDAVFKYVQLRPSALTVDPKASHAPHWVQRQRGCRTGPALQPRFE